MTHTHITFKELFNFGWGEMKEHFAFLLVIFIGLFVVSAATGWVPVLGDIVGGLASIAMIWILLMIVRNKTPDYKNLLDPFTSYKITLHYFICTILYVLSILGGLVLLILPGIFFAIRLQFVSCIAVDHETMHPFDAFKKSWHMTRGRFWQLFGYQILFILFNLTGLLAFGIGLLFTIPITAVAFVHLYDRLQHVSPVHNEHASTIAV